MNALGVRWGTADPSRETKQRHSIRQWLFPAAAGGVIGAVAMFLLDPDRGRRRRAHARDRTAAIARRGGRQTGREIRRMRASLFGLTRRVRNLPHRPEPAANDQTLTDRILSQAFRDLDVPVGRLNINVEEGVAVLHGALDETKQIRDVETAVRKIAGVRDVASYLHLSETPAPEERPRQHS